MVKNHLLKYLEADEVIFFVDVKVKLIHFMINRTQLTHVIYHWAVFFGAGWTLIPDVM